VVSAIRFSHQLTILYPLKAGDGLAEELHGGPFRRKVGYRDSLRFCIRGGVSSEPKIMDACWDTCAKANAGASSRIDSILGFMRRSLLLKGGDCQQVSRTAPCIVRSGEPRVLARRSIPLF
jgi:hypothetical protein